MAARRFGLMSDSHSTQLPKVPASMRRSAACTSRRRPESRSILPIAMSRSLASWIRSSSSGLDWIARASRFPFPFRLSVLQGFSECVQFGLCNGLNACPFLTFFESRCYSFRTSEATFPARACRRKSTLPRTRGTVLRELDPDPFHGFT